MNAELTVGAGAQQVPAGTRRRVPDQSLLTYYVLVSFIAGPFFPFVLIPYYFRYRTLRYEFDAEGITMRWGVLFRKEISLTYARIQDIHLTSNVVERWLGLARIQIQTASGSAGPEMTIEGLKDYEAIRNELYSRMRGVRDDRPTGAISSPGAAHQTAPRPGEGGVHVAISGATPDTAELVAAMRETAAELRRLRESLTGIANPDVGGGDDL